MWPFDTKQPFINPKLSTCYIANVGKGKTMLMTYLHALPALQAGVKVVSDFRINWKGSNLSYFTPEEFDDVCMSWRNCILLIDEIGAIIDSRQFKDEGSNTRRFFSYHRKHHVEIISSTQHISLVAKTSKNMVTDWIICDQILDGAIAKALLGLIGFRGVAIKAQRVELIELANEKNQIDPEAPLIMGNIDKGKTYWLGQKKLIRSDLDDLKEELDHTGCTLCKTRFTDKDLKDTKNNTICPLCMEESIGKLTSIMYDTDYELPEKTEAIKRVSFQRQVLKWENINVALSEEELELKRKLEGVEWKQREKSAPRSRSTNAQSPIPF